MQKTTQDEEERAAAAEAAEAEDAAAGAGDRVVIGDADVDVANPEQGRRPAILRAPLRVTQAERDEHNLTHIPCRRAASGALRA